MERLSKLILLALSVQGCAPQDDACGPATGVVSRVIDGDTIDLESGERVRYLLINTPELDECFFDEATMRNEELVQQKTISLEYDNEQCTDQFGRLLALISVDGVGVNESLVDDGYACALYIPPAGTSRREEFVSRQTTAQSQGKGMWSQCPSITCN